MIKTVEILSDLDQLVQRALEILLAKIELAIAERGRFTIALAGGSTPKPLYAAIARQNLAWEKIHVFWGDERYVPPDHPESNAGMATQIWLDQVPLPAANIHPIPTAAANPVDAAQQYAQDLQAFFQSQPGEFPAFDVILLGIGTDGHTASLFPHTAALQVCDRTVTVGHKDDQPRITLTVPVLNRARCVMFLVTGENKRPALAEIFAPEADALEYPARFVQPAGQMIWLLDQAAGAELSP